MVPEAGVGSVSMRVCCGGVLFESSVASSLGFGEGGFLGEMVNTFDVGVFAFGDIRDFPEWFRTFLRRDFLLFLLGRFLNKVFRGKKEGMGRGQ